MGKTPERTGPKQKNTRFKPGESGNPTGRPKGARNRATVAVQALLEGEAEALTRKAIEKALDGDITALRLCMDRIAPAPKDRPLDPDAVKLPPLRSGKLSEASAAIIRAVAAGRLTPSEGQALAGLLESHRRAVELVELEDRISKLETQDR
jgi:hypothetical protein